MRVDEVTNKREGEEERPVNIYFKEKRQQKNIQEGRMRGRKKQLKKVVPQNQQRLMATSDSIL